MSNESESPILRLLLDMRAVMGDMRAEVGDIRSEMVTKSELRSELNSLRADVAADIIDFREDLSGQIVGLRRAVVEYHTSVIGPA